MKPYLLSGLMLVALVLSAAACGSSEPAPTASPTSTPVSDRSAEATATTQPETPSPTATERTTVSATATSQSSTSVPTESPTAKADSEGSVPAAMVEPDPNYQDALESARFRTGGWETDFSLHTVPYGEFQSGGVPRDGIPPLDEPQFESISDADKWLDDVQPVVSLEINNASRAYPLAILTWHEIANDTLGGVPLSVTFCPLCNSAIAFDRRVGEATLDFGVSGNLRNSDLVMWDRQTESWWQQLTGEGIVGAYAGYQLDLVPAQIVSWGDFKTAFPEADVLSRNTGHTRAYGNNPYYGYDRVDQSPFLFDGRPDDRLLPMERIAALVLDGQPLAFPFLTLEEEKAVNFASEGGDIVVLFRPGTASALDQSRISESRDVGSTGVFEAELEGQTLTFRAEGDGFVDDRTGSTWNVLGQAVSGPLSSKALTPIVHGNHFWFAWAAFAPETQVYPGQ